MEAAQPVSNKGSLARPMYDMRVPDAIDNALFLALCLGMLISGVVVLALVVLVGGMWSLAWLVACVATLVAGTYALGRRG